MPAASIPDASIKISNREARRFLLAHQYLWPPRSLKGKAGIRTLFKRLGSIQYDTINTAGRNADLVLQSRLADHTPALLADALYKDRFLVDGWDKMASIYPIEDWPYFSRQRETSFHFRPERAEMIIEKSGAVLEELHQRGPLSSLDFANEEKVLWSWGSATSMARASLEYLHSIGKIGIHDKVGTRRIFDLVERLIPAEILAQEEPYPETKDYHDWHILRRVGSKGITSLRAGEHWLGIRRAKASERRAGIARLTEKGELLPIAVEGLSETFYIRTQDRDILEKALKGRAPKAKAAFIAPLDNFMWDRTLIKDLFDFEYIWEVYKPKNTRQYGYYVLPVLYGDQIVGRIEPKLDRKTNILWINNWWWEAGFKPDAETLSALRECLLHFQKYLGAAEIKLGEPLQGKRTFTWIKVKG